MKIAIFTDSFSPHINGVVTTIINIVKKLSDRGHKVYVIAPKFKGIKEFEYKDVKVLRINSVSLFFYPTIKVSLPFDKGLYNKLKRIGIDIIHFHVPLTIGFQGIMMAKMFKVPLVGTYHTFFADPMYLKNAFFNGKFTQKMVLKYLNSYYNRCDVITTPSYITKKELISNKIKRPIKVISNGIDMSVFDNKDSKLIRKKYIDSPDDILCLYVGRIAYEKNIEKLIDSFNIVISKNKNVKLLIVGDGPQKKDLISCIDKYALLNNIKYLGEIEHERLVTSGIFGACDIFVTMSTTETQGITLLEGLCNGLPAIGIAKGGTIELIRHNKNGFLVKKDDPENFAKAVIDLVKDDKLRKRFSKEALKISSEHEMEGIIDKLEKLYKITINNYKKIK